MPDLSQIPLLQSLVQGTPTGDTINANVDQQSAEQCLLEILGAQGPPPAEPAERNYLAEALIGIGDIARATSAGLTGRPAPSETALDKLFARRQARADEETARQDKQFEQKQRVAALQAELDAEGAGRAAQAASREAGLVRQQVAEETARNREIRAAKLASNEDIAAAVQSYGGDLSEYDLNESSGRVAARAFVAKREREENRPKTSTKIPESDRRRFDDFTEALTVILSGDPSVEGSDLTSKLLSGEVTEEQVLSDVKLELRKRFGLSDDAVYDEAEKIAMEMISPALDAVASRRKDAETATRTEETLKTNADVTRSDPFVGPERPIRNILAEFLGLSGEGFRSGEPGLGVQKDQSPEMRKLESLLRSSNVGGFQ